MRMAVEERAAREVELAGVHRSAMWPERVDRFRWKPGLHVGAGGADAMRHDADGARAVRLAGVLLGELVRGVIGELETATAAGVAACDLLNKRAGHGLGCVRPGFP